MTDPAVDTPTLIPLTRKKKKRSSSYLITLTVLKFSDPKRELLGGDLTIGRYSPPCDRLQNQRGELQFKGKTCTVFSFLFFLTLSLFY